MSKLRFVRDETSNAVTFVIKQKKKTIRLQLPLEEFALALMAGKEVNCAIDTSENEVVKKKKGKVRK